MKYPRHQTVHVISSFYGTTPYPNVHYTRPILFLRIFRKPSNSNVPNDRYLRSP